MLTLLYRHYPVITSPNYGVFIMQPLLLFSVFVAEMTLITFKKSTLVTSQT